MLRRIILLWTCLWSALAADTASVQGTVRDSVNGSAARGMRVLLYGTRLSYATSIGVDGSFTLDRVEPGRYRMEFESGDYSPTPVGPGAGVISLQAGERLKGLTLLAMRLGTSPVKSRTLKTSRWWKRS